MAAWAALPLTLGVAVGLPIWRLLNGAQYDQAFGLLVILLIGFFAALLWNISLNVLMAHRDYGFVALVAGLGLLFTLVAGVVLVPRWGAWASAGITAAHTALMYFVLYLRVRYKNY
jgi:O-antigen/teichoic acid export membrane protein